MKIPVRISASQLVLKKTIAPAVLDTPIPKVSLPSSSVAVEPLTQTQACLCVKTASTTRSSVPWDAILIGAAVLVVLGVIYYQLQNRKSVS